MSRCFHSPPLMDEPSSSGQDKQTHLFWPEQTNQSLFFRTGEKKNAKVWPRQTASERKIFSCPGNLGLDIFQGLAFTCEKCSRRFSGSNVFRTTGTFLGRAGEGGGGGGYGSSFSIGDICIILRCVLEVPSTHPLARCEFSGNVPAVFSHELIQTFFWWTGRKRSGKCPEQLTRTFAFSHTSPSPTSVHVVKQLQSVITTSHCFTPLVLLVLVLLLLLLLLVLFTSSSLLLVYYSSVSMLICLQMETIRLLLLLPGGTWSGSKNRECFSLTGKLITFFSDCEITDLKLVSEAKNLTCLCFFKTSGSLTLKE